MRPTTLQDDGSQPGRGDDPADGRRLGVIDELQLLRHDRERARAGSRGNLAQAHYRTSGVIDEDRLRRALEEGLAVFPEMTARLVRGGWLGGTRWVFDRRSPPPLRVSSMEGGEEALLAYASELGKRWHDVERGPQVEFHLLRRPGRGDVLVVAFSRVAMDGRAPDRLLAELNRLASGDPPAVVRGEESTRPLREYLARFPRRRRVRAVVRYAVSLRRRRREPSRPLALGRRTRSSMTPAARYDSLSADETGRLRGRARELLGFENLSPVIVACAFRSLTAELPSAADEPLRTNVPISVSHPRMNLPVFSNFVSLLPVALDPAETVDREATVRKVSRQLRDAIGEDLDLGQLEFASWLRLPASFMIRRGDGRVPHPSKLIGPAFSFSFSFRGEIEGLDPLFGAPLEASYTIPTGYGEHLSACLAAGRLHVLFAYAEEALERARAESYVDRLMDELRALGEGRA